MWKELRANWRIRRTPKFDETAPQFGQRVHATARVLRTNLDVTPFTGRECAFYAVELLEWENGTLQHLLTVTSQTVIDIGLGDHNILFDPAGCVPHCSKHIHEGHSEDSREEMASFLAKHEEPLLTKAGGHWGLLTERSIHWKERLVLPGDRVRVCGTLSKRISIKGDSHYREPPQQFVIGAPDAIITDKC